MKGNRNEPGKPIKTVVSFASLPHWIKFFADGDPAERFQKVKQISGILEELDAYRQSFVKTSDIADLFPAVYFHVTRIELDAILSNRMMYPVEKMEMMMRFYDAYRSNRNAFDRGGSQVVEPQWGPYYQEVEAAAALRQRSKNIPLLKLKEQVQTALAAGIIAHVDYDLPRAIR